MLRSPRSVRLAAALLPALAAPLAAPTAVRGDDPGETRRAAPAAVPGLLAFWDFQEPAGARRVSTGKYQYPLAERNGPIARVEDGLFGPYAVDFEPGQWMTLPHDRAPGLDLHGDDQQVSVVAWVKRQSDRHWQFIGGMWNERDHARQYGLFLSGAWRTDWTTYERARADNQAMGYVSPLGGATPGHPFAFDYATGGTPIPKGRWAMIGYTFDGEWIRVYVDGELDAAGNYNPFRFGGGIHDGGSDFTVAQRAVPKWPDYPEGRPTNETGFDGRLAGLAVYGRALTPAEMRTLYEQTLGTLTDDGPADDGPAGNVAVGRELDAFWAEAARTVREGDFDGYAGLYHPDAVFVSDVRGEVRPIAEQLTVWQPGFTEAAAGRAAAEVAFRFTQRLHGPTTAYETGLFRYVSRAPGGAGEPAFVRFEALLVRGPDGWRWVMERQTATATAAEWDAAAPE